MLGIEVLGVKPQPAAQSSKSRRTTAGLGRIDLARDVLPLRAAVGPRGGDLDIVVAVDAPAGDMAGQGLAEQGVVGALLGALAG